MCICLCVCVCCMTPPFFGANSSPCISLGLIFDFCLDLAYNYYMQTCYYIASHDDSRTRNIVSNDAFSLFFIYGRRPSQFEFLVRDSKKMMDFGGIYNRTGLLLVNQLQFTRTVGNFEFHANLDKFKT